MATRALWTVVLAGVVSTSVTSAAAAAVTSVLPAHGARQVNPDTHLVLRFDQPLVLGKSGLIRIYDAANGKLVDALDLSIPAGPTERTKLPAAPYLATPYVYADGPRATNANTKAARMRRPPLRSPNGT